MRRSSIVAGIILILVGLFFLVLPLFPNISGIINIADQWPLIIVAVGALFLISALVGAPGLAIPGAIITGIGGLLYYQNVTGAWASWSYAWALIPGFVGVGIIIANALEGNTRRGIRSGGNLIIISLIMFLAFGAFLGGGISFSVLWAILFIGLGLRIVLRTIRSGRSDESAARAMDIESLKEQEEAENDF